MFSSALDVRIVKLIETDSGVQTVVICDCYLPDRWRSQRIKCSMQLDEASGADTLSGHYVRDTHGVLCVVICDARMLMLLSLWMTNTPLRFYLH